MPIVFVTVTQPAGFEFVSSEVVVAPYFIFGSVPESFRNETAANGPYAWDGDTLPSFRNATAATGPYTLSGTT